MKLTRRKLASVVLVPAAAALAQPQPAAPPATPEQELQAARDRAKALSDTLARQAVAMATEPAFQFKA